MTGRARKTEPPATLPPKDPTIVTPADLGHLDDVSSLLSTLNDPRAGADALARHLDRLPVLKARIAARFQRQYPGRSLPETVRQVALLGNRTIEAILLELLEDIVTLASEVGSANR